MNIENYFSYVEHPRYGKGPRFTGSDPDRNDPNVNFHWRVGIHSDEMRACIRKMYGGNMPLCKEYDGVIRGTAVEADLSKQVAATMPITHYYDEERRCRKCGRKFIFFAEEQKYWYEELGFKLDANCIHCTDCRRINQEIARLRKRYEELFHKKNRTSEESFEMSICCLTLIEEGIFHFRQTENIRAIINKLPSEKRADSSFDELVARLHNIEKQFEQP